MIHMLATHDVVALAHQLRGFRHEGSQIRTDQLVSLPLAIEAAVVPGSNIPLMLWLNKQVAFDDAAQHPTKDVLTWLCDYANDRSRPASSLRAGAIITTGSLCGAVDVSDPCEVSVQLGVDAVLNFTLS
ncbi:Hypothetical protein NGAL_HAMBI2605_31180 [Neorhizobium galegae bv. orientalis]|nr:Hypothetical protein NGAL_HAMBI2605_31180 [Neorhizobium galegae bv. orientalis]